MDLKKSLLIGSLVLGMFSLTAISAFADTAVKIPGEPNFGSHMGERAAHMQEMKEQMDQVFEDEDYDAWVALHEDKPMFEESSDLLTQDNFQKMVEAHKLMDAGDFEDAGALREEMGFPQRGPGKGFGKGFGGEGHRGCQE